jgi:hypothetical protein
MEGAATTVYAQGGRGNSRLVAWEGERTVTFTMEDALISPAGFMILSGAGLVEASSTKTIKVHTTEQTNNVIVTTGSGDTVTGVTIQVKEKPFSPKSNEKGYGEDWIYVMLLDNGEVMTEPYIGTYDGSDATDGLYTITLKSTDDLNGHDKYPKGFSNGCVVLVDYYTEKTSGAQEITITPDKFGGNYYLEASTLFRDTNGVDMPAEFVIPNCKIQSNFTFTMASSGDPSTFTFTMDAFPDYTRFDDTKKVLAAIQIVATTSSEEEAERPKTWSTHTDAQLYGAVSTIE